MIRIESTEDIKEFWARYWGDVFEDADTIVDYEYYPFTLLKKYLKPGQKVLEAGCGTGRVLKGLCNEGYDIVGFDYDLGALKSINRRRYYPVFLADIQNVPLKSNSFDLVLCFGVVTCLQDEASIHNSLKEISNLLSENGVLIISLLNYNLLRRLQRYKGIVKGLFNTKHFHAWADSRRNLEALLVRDFEMVEMVPSLSRQPLYDYIPFLRKRHDVNRTLARVNDREYALNRPGETLFALLKRSFPYMISGSSTFVCKRKI